MAGRNRDELIGIIQKLIALEPMLELVIEKMTSEPPLTVQETRSGEAPNRTVSVKYIRKRLNDALDAIADDEDEGEWDDDWDTGPLSSLEEYLRDERASSDVDDAFAEAVGIAELHEQADRHADAAAVFAEVAWIGIDRFNDSNKNEAVYRQILASARGLVRGLERQASMSATDQFDPAFRTQLLEALFEIWIFTGHGHWEADGLLAAATSGDRELELSGPDYTDAIAAAITSEEREKLEGLWRAEVESDASEAWRRRTAIEFGIALNGPDGLRESEVLDLITRAKLWWDQALFLVRQGRTDEAILVAARKLTDPAAALSFANQLCGTGDDGLDRAIRFIDERLWETEGKDQRQDIAYMDWLANAYERCARLTDALDVRIRVFKSHPVFTNYLELQRVAIQPGIDPDRRPLVRESALKILTEKGLIGTEMQIYLNEGNAREALRLLKSHRENARSGGGSIWNYGFHQYEEQVAKLAEREFPEEAIQIRRRIADRLIGYKSRDNYQLAVPHLAAIKVVLEANGRAEEWKTLIGKLRAGHSKLRALQDELNKAGLT